MSASNAGRPVLDRRDGRTMPSAAGAPMMCVKIRVPALQGKAGASHGVGVWMFLMTLHPAARNPCLRLSAQVSRSCIPPPPSPRPCMPLSWVTCMLGRPAANLYGHAVHRCHPNVVRPAGRSTHISPSPNIVEGPSSPSGFGHLLSDSCVSHAGANEAASSQWAGTQRSSGKQQA